MPNNVIYRSDGASRGQGTDGECMAGWGAAVWNATPDGHGAGAPAATARGYLGEASNNVAEYAGIRACLRRAARNPEPRIMFEVDSMLLARQLARHHPWACRAEGLLPYFVECASLCEYLSAIGVDWNIRHVYRELNQVADALSNQAIDERDTNGASSAW